MNFTDYQGDAARLGPDLVNTFGWVSGNEYLGTVEALRDFLASHGIAAGMVTEDDLAAVQALRGEVREIFDATSVQEASRIVNRLGRRAPVRPELTDHDGHWHVHYAAGVGTVADRLASQISVSLALMISEHGLSRFGVCAAHNCDDVFVDVSKNRSRRFCEDTCSTRTHVAAHRARHR